MALVPIELQRAASSAHAGSSGCRSATRATDRAAACGDEPNYAADESAEIEEVLAVEKLLELPLVTARAPQPERLSRADAPSFETFVMEGQGWQRWLGASR